MNYWSNKQKCGCWNIRKVDDLPKSSSLYHREDKEMKIKNTITEADLDRCYDILIATVSIMLIMSIVWKVFA